MTRTSEDWREGAEQNVKDALSEARATAKGVKKDIDGQLVETEQTLLGDGHDRSERRDSVRELRKTLVASAHALLDTANEVEKLRTGSTLRGLEGKEPVGYSKRDGGASHDALYGAKASGRAIARKVRWPLDLENWDAESANQTRNGVDPVTATGTKKYTTTVGGRAVHVVIDSRGYCPI